MPKFGLRIQHGFGCTDDGCIHLPVGSNSPGEPWYCRTSKIIWNSIYRKLESAMALDRNRVFARDLIQCLPGGSSIECWIYDKTFDIVLQVDGPMNLRLHTRVQNTPRCFCRRITRRQREFAT
ncbi:MAG TPA: hypothetical protein VMG30_17605 [Acidobacteriota bacterium]|nr:hypothetical protein [Acidobacteriota bacterium]